MRYWVLEVNIFRFIRYLYQFYFLPHWFDSNSLSIGLFSPNISLMIVFKVSIISCFCLILIGTVYVISTSVCYCFSNMGILHKLLCFRNTQMIMIFWCSNHYTDPFLYYIMSFTDPTFWFLLPGMFPPCISSINVLIALINDQWSRFW